MKAAFYTLGCKVNQYDTQAMREIFEDAGYEVVDFDEVADVYVVNTCTVTQTGDQKSRQMISRAHARAPEARIVVAGCYAQRAPEEVLRLPGVALVMGSKDRNRVLELLQTRPGKPHNAVGALAYEHTFETMTVRREGRTRAHLKIQEGCDRYCAYCIIPYARGPLRSRPLADVRRQMEILNAAGYPEIVLTGIHLMSYGKDFRDAQTDLRSAIAQAEGLANIRRIRLGSLEPQLLSPDFVAALRDNERICRQFHLSLQSGSAGVLRRMRRRYTPEEYARCAALIREAMPDCALTTDVIVGFPGETEAEFQESVAFVRAMGFARIHVFPFSRRAGTPAYDMPGQIPRVQKQARARALIAVGAELEQAYLQSRVGRTEQVLFEQQQGDFYEGYTDGYAHVWAKSDELVSGRLLSVRIDGVTDAHLDGTISL